MKVKNKLKSKKEINSKVLEKGKNYINQIEIISILLLILDLTSYFSLNKIVNIIILFITFMSISIILINVLNYLCEKKEDKKKEKYINNILSLTLIIHISIIGIILGRICYCGNHYFYVIPLIIFGIVEVVLYHIFVKNYKKEKNAKYLANCFLIMNLLFITVVLLSKVNMERLHNELYTS